MNMKQSPILEKMQKKHKKLINSRNNTKKYVENLIEYAMYGDAKDEDVFDYFAEENILSLIYLQMKKQDTLTTAFIIEKISMLFINVKKELNMNYLLSNPILNDFIKFSYNFAIPEMVDFYVNFLKTIAQRVDKHNFNLYFNQKYSSFPLLWQTQKFLNYPDSLVRNTVQNIILSLTKLASSDQQDLQTKSIIFQQNKLVTQFRNYLLYSPFIIVYNSYIHQYLLGIISLEHELSLDKLKEIDERNLDIILFFKDLFESIPFLGDVLVEQFMCVAVKPILDCILLGNSKFLNVGCQLGLYAIYNLMSHLPLKHAIIKYLMDDKIDDYQAFTKKWDKQWKYIDESSDQVLYQYFDKIFDDKWEPINQKLNQIDNPYKQQFKNLLRSKDGVLLNLTLSILQLIQEEQREIYYSGIVEIFDYENIHFQTWDIVSYLLMKQVSVEKELQNKFQKQKCLFDQFVEHCGNNEPKSLFANWQLIEELQRQSIADRKVVIGVNVLIPQFEAVDMSHLKVVYKYVLLSKLVFGETPQMEMNNPLKVGSQIDRFHQKGQFIKLHGKEEFLVLDDEQGKIMHIVAEQGTLFGTVKFIEPLRAIEASMKEDVLTIEREKHCISPMRGYQLLFNRNNAEEILKAIFVAQKQSSEKVIIKLLQLQI